MILGSAFGASSGRISRTNTASSSTGTNSERLKRSAGSAAILVPILSATYATSEFCGKEWEWFRDNPPLEWIAGNQTVYRVCPFAWREIEPELRQQVAVDIRRAQEDRSLSPADLALKLANGLRMMRRSRETVYLGESEHEIRRKVRDELSRMGFRVEPEAPSAFTDPETIRTLLGKAKLAIHFVGGQESQLPLDAIRDSRQYCQYSTLVYEVPGVDLSAEEKFSLEWLEDDLKQSPASDSRAYDRISGTHKNLDQFLQIIRDRLEGARPVFTTQIGIACEEHDRRAVDFIIPEIQTRTGFSVVCHGLSLLDFKKSRGILLYWVCLRADGCDRPAKS
jgi:hypothetical protein